MVDIGGAALPAILALNNLHAVELSWLDLDRLTPLIGRAYYARMTADAAAFLIAFDADAAYDSPNYLWFRARMTGFVYVDRVAVAAPARGRGLARALYDDLFRRVGADGLGPVCCEVNADPPNPASDAFHRTLGFRALGEGTVPPAKTVHYLVRESPRERPAAQAQ